MNILIKNTLALIWAEKKYSAQKADIYISGEDILAVNEKPEGFVAEKVIDGEGYLTIPGLVNAHTHAYMSLFRNIADDLPFEEWLFGRIDPLEGKLTDEDAFRGAMLACAEMIKSGTTSFLDMHMFKNKSAEAADETGMRAVLSRGLVGKDRTDEGGLRRLDEALSEAEQWKGHPRLGFMLAPHAIYTCGEDYLSYVIETAKEHNLPLHTHLAEAVTEMENCKKEHGMTPTAYLDSLGFFDVKTVAAHCVQLTAEDTQILKSKNVSVIHNPRSNLKLGNGVAPVYELEKAGVNICMGTDSAASNNSLNLFGDMRAAALLQKTGRPTAVGTNEVLRYATVNGASALGINAGAIEKGKKADLALLRLNCPQFCPRNDLAASLVYSANGSETDTVIINGEIVLENGKLTKVDEEEIYAKAEESIARISR